MKKLLILLSFCIVSSQFLAQARGGKKPSRNSTKRTTTQKPRTPKPAPAAKPVAAAPQVSPTIDSLPISNVKPSLPGYYGDAIIGSDTTARTPLPYEHIRLDDAIFRHKIWREIDSREKQNLVFRYNSEENNGNQRFAEILFKAVQDGKAKAFSNVDDRFTTPLSIKELRTILAGPDAEVDIYGPTGEVTGKKIVPGRVNWDSVYKFRIKEEVIFDKESSRLFWRIIGIAPVKRVITASGIELDEQEVCWFYYPELRPILTDYQVYNGKNMGARMSWEEYFEGRFFYGRIIKSTVDNYANLEIKDYKGLSENTILQLLEGERVKEKIFNYEQDLWSY